MGFDFATKILGAASANQYGEITRDFKKPQQAAANSAFDKAFKGQKSCQLGGADLYGGEGGAQVSVKGTCSGKKVGATFDYSGPGNMSVTTDVGGKTQRTQLPK